jgi:hypothetical protein
MTPSPYHRLVTALLTCSLLLAPLASADPLVTGSKDDTSNYIYSSNGGVSILGKLYSSTAFHIEKIQPYEINNIIYWAQTFQMLQGDHTIQIDPPPRGIPLDSIVKSYGKVITSSPNLMTNPIISRDEVAGGLTGGAPVNNPENNVLADVAINMATAMVTELFTKADPTGTLALAQKMNKFVAILAPVFRSESRAARWNVEFDHQTGPFQTPASTSSHYITFETFTLPNLDQITLPGLGGKTVKTKEDLIRAGTKPACFTYVSGVDIKESVLTKTDSQTFVFVRGQIPPGVDPSDPRYGVQHSFKLAPDGKSCNPDMGEIATRFTRTEQSHAPQRPTIGDELEQVLETWGTSAA